MLFVERIDGHDDGRFNSWAARLPRLRVESRPVGRTGGFQHNHRLARSHGGERLGGGFSGPGPLQRHDHVRLAKYLFGGTVGHQHHGLIAKARTVARAPKHGRLRRRMLQ